MISSFMYQALWIVALLSAVPLIAGSLVGFVVSIFQAATQLQEQTTVYMFKFFTICAVLGLGAAAGSQLLTEFFERMFALVPMIGRL